MASPQPELNSADPLRYLRPQPPHPAQYALVSFQCAHEASCLNEAFVTVATLLSANIRGDTLYKFIKMVCDVAVELARDLHESQSTFLAAAPDFGVLIISKRVDRMDFGEIEDLRLDSGECDLLSKHAAEIAMAGFIDVDIGP